jgi:hypothetical protein
MRRFHPLHTKLVNGMARLYRQTSGPFGVVVTEALRGIGVPVLDAPPEEIRDEVAELVHLYFEAATEGDPFVDILGPVFEEVSSRGGKQMSGQFFTPYDLCRMMAEMQLSDWRPEPKPDGELWAIHEPASGSGAMLLAALAYLAKEHGPGVLRMWRVQAIDVDLTLARTCALQIITNLAALPAAIGELEVLHGDTLRMEIRNTVVRMHASPLLDVLGMLSTVDRALDQVADEAPPERTYTQVSMFSEEAA